MKVFTILIACGALLVGGCGTCCKPQPSPYTNQGGSMDPFIVGGGEMRGNATAKYNVYPRDTITRSECKCAF